MIYTTTPSPIGELLLAGDGTALNALHMDGTPASGWERDEDAFAEVRAQLGEYFAGDRRDFDVDLALDGTPFQREVWSALRAIPYGETISYGELARRVNRPWASRAVGAANGRNPVAIIVPCHRVIGADGTLTGYGGGLERKRTLLDLERGARPLS
jgi:methylated-DNA-[protein]-cysteine S-methyltransferase